MLRLTLFCLFIVLLLMSSPQEACAHFLFAHVVRGSNPRIELHFAESAWDFSSSPRMIELMKPTHSWIPNGVTLTYEATPFAMTAPLNENDSTVCAAFTYGLMTRGEAFLLQYHAKGVCGIEAASIPTGMDAEIIAESINDDQLLLTVLFKGTPVSDAEILVPTQGNVIEQMNTDEHGQVMIPMPSTPLFSIRAMVPEKTSGTFQDDSYELVRHYVTLTVHVNQDIPANCDGLAWAILHDAYASNGAAQTDTATWEAKYRSTVGNNTAQGSLEDDGNTIHITHVTGEKDSSQIHAGHIHLMHAIPPSSRLANQTIQFKNNRKASSGCVIEIPEMNTSMEIQDRSMRSVHHDGDIPLRVDLIGWETTEDNRMLPKELMITAFESDGSIRSVTSLNRTYVEQDGKHVLKSQSGTVIEGKDQSSQMRLQMSDIKIN